MTAAPRRDGEGVNVRRRWFLAAGGTALLAGCTSLRCELAALAEEEGAPTEIVDWVTPEEGCAVESIIEVRNDRFDTRSENGRVRGTFSVEVENKGTEPFSAVAIVPEFYDADGNPVGMGRDEINDLEPGSVWAACVPFRGDATRVDSYATTGSFVRGRVTRPAEDSQILGHRLTGEGCGATVVGSAFYGGTRDRRYLEANATFIDDAGRVVGTARDNTTDLKPGDRWSFAIRSTFDVTDYELELREGWW